MIRMFVQIYSVTYMLVLVAGFAGYVNRGKPKHQQHGLEMVKPTLSLKVLPQTNHLTITVINASSELVRLWELKNSWGYYSFSVHLKQPEGKETYVLKRRVRDWTKNGPDYYTILPHEERDLLFNVKDETWYIPPAIAQLRDQQIYVRVQMTIESSPEAEQYGVYVGSIKSEWITSLPPHSWLFNLTDGRN